MNFWLMLFVIHLLALITPGPDFFIVSKVAISVSRRAAMATVCGVVVGVMAWAGIALLGLHLLLAKIAWLQVSIKLAGGAYLLYLGVVMLCAPSVSAAPDDNEKAPSTMSDRSAFWRGLLTNLSNPKAAIYFGSIFAALLTPATSKMDKFTMFSIVTLEALVWFSLVAMLFSLPALRRQYWRARTWIDRVAGIAFASFGLRLLLTSRS